MEPRVILGFGKSIYYYTAGKGQPLVLIHGYQADARIWKLVVPLLEKKYQLIVPDLPGHGKSPLLGNVNSMDKLAELVYKICLSLGLNGVSVAGHSMGGFVAIALAEKYPTYIDSLALINSHPFADSITKSLARNREAEIIKEGKKHMLLRNFVKKVFSQPGIENAKGKMELATRIALSQPDEGMLADLSGMMLRKDQREVISKSRFHTLFIAGKNDEELVKIIPFCEGRKGTKLIQLENSGHLSILEQPETVAKLLEDFVK